MVHLSIFFLTLSHFPRCQKMLASTCVFTCRRSPTCSALCSYCCNPAPPTRVSLKNDAKAARYPCMKPLVAISNEVSLFMSLDEVFLMCGFFIQCNQHRHQIKFDPLKFASPSVLISLINSSTRITCRYWTMFVCWSVCPILQFPSIRWKFISMGPHFEIVISVKPVVNLSDVCVA